jgi:hypothetical protein
VEKHLDVLGYLLVAVVFSVGFLSARIHANYDTILREVGDLSWRVRETVLSGGRLGPADLGELLSTLRRAGDPVATATRWANVGIFICTAVVFADGLVLLAEGATAPNHAPLELTMLFLVAAIVTAIGEYDVRRVATDQRSSIEASTLGRLDAVASSLANNDMDAVRRGIANLRESLPNWGLLIELQAFVELRTGEQKAALHRLEQLTEDTGDLHITPVVGAAAALAIGDEAAAIELLQRVSEVAPNARYVDELRSSLGLRRAYLQSLFEDISQLSVGHNAVEQDVATNAHHVAAALIGANTELGKMQATRLALDLAPAELPETANLVRANDAWHRATDAESIRSLIDGTALEQLLCAVGLLDESGAPEERLLRFAQTSEDQLTLESCGLILLALGSQRNAIRIFERSIRLMPAAPLAHWGTALASAHVGWSDAAITALQRAETLTGDEPIIRITRRVLEGADTMSPEEALQHFPRAGISDLDRFELALLGIEVAPARLPSAVISSQFVERAISLALNSGRAPVPERLGDG